MTHPDARSPAEQRLSVRLAPGHAFTEASASIEAALAQLEKAERALERQLSDLRDYVKREVRPVSA